MCLFVANSKPSDAIFFKGCFTYQLSGLIWIRERSKMRAVKADPAIFPIEIFWSTSVIIISVQRESNYVVLQFPLAKAGTGSCASGPFVVW